MLNLGEILTLSDNKKYTVVNSINYLNNDYSYLVEISNTENIKICLVKDNNLIEVVDEDLINQLEELFISNISD